jgi:hypothetical protein
MRSKDFIREAGRNGSSEFDVDPNAKRADTPDWLKNAGKWLGNKIGMNEPVALPDYTASSQQDAAAKSNYRGIDPIQRQSLGMAPATQQEIDAYVKAHPPVIGGLTGADGKPIASGGALDMERAARAAAPSRRADFDVDSYAGAPDPAAVGDRFYTPRELGFHPGGTMPGEKKSAAVAAASPSSATVQGGASGAAAAVAPAPAARISKVPSAAVVPSADIVPEPVAAAANPPPTLRAEPVPDANGGNRLNRLTGKVDDENTKQDDAALARIKDLSRDSNREGGVSSPNDIFDPSKAKSGDQTVNIGGKSGDAEADVGPVVEPKKDQKKKTQNKEPDLVQPPVINTKPTPGGDNKRISGNTIAPEIVIPPGTPGTMLPGVKDIEGRQVWRRPDSSEMAWDPKKNGWFPTGILNPTTKNSGATYPQPGDIPPGTPGTMLPGVKDSEGRQVWRRPDSSEMAWDPKTQRWHPISIFNRKFNSAPQGSQGSEPAPASSSILNRFKTVDAVDAEIKRFLDKGYDMRLPANQQYVNNLTARRAEVAKVRESSDIGRMRLLAGLIKD